MSDEIIVKMEDPLPPVEVTVSEVGLVGPEGPEGPQGIRGLKGDPGVQGQTGIQGPAGPEGVEGPRGFEGPRGLQGIEGPRGLQGIQGIPGPVGPARYNPQGDYDPDRDYVDGDVVNHAGSTWFAQNDPPKGELPSQSSSFWHYLSLKGADGAQGPQGEIGPQGPKGPDGPSGGQGIQGPAGYSPRTYTTATGSYAFGSMFNGATRVFTLDNPIDVTLGATVSVTVAGSTTQRLVGKVSAISPTSISVVIDYYSGSGTYANWNVQLSGDRGAAGATGAMPRTSTTSTTSNAINTNGSKTWTIAAPLDLVVGQEVLAFVTDAPGTWMTGTITALSSTSITVAISGAQSSGTFTNWTIVLAGKRGAAGAAGSTGLSAYQVWLAAGNAGTEADYLTSLKGAKGEDASPRAIIISSSMPNPLVDISNVDTTEATMFALPIDPSKLADGDVLYLDWSADMQNNTGSSPPISMRFYLGGILFATGGTNVNANTNRKSLRGSACIHVLSRSGVQRASTAYTIGGNGTGLQGTSLGGVGTSLDGVSLVAADLTVPTTLVVAQSWQPNTIVRPIAASLRRVR